MEVLGALALLCAGIVGGFLAQCAFDVLMGEIEL